MWTRAELKSRAKAGLTYYYWYGLLVTFVAGLLGGNASGGIQISLPAQSFSRSSDAFSEFELGFFLLALVVALVISLLAYVFICLVSNVVQIGKCRYFTISTMNGHNAGFEELFAGFKKGRYWNLVKVQFFRGLFQWLWTLVFVIPGIVKHYEYYMVPYLAAEYPEMDRREIFRLSKEMMDGNKFDTWVLELSFIGWEILGLLACCIGGVFLLPYKEATYAELYLRLREDRLGLSRAGQGDVWVNP